MRLPQMPPGEEVVQDYRALSLSLKDHPVRFLRAQLAARGILANEALPRLAHGRRVTVAGLVLVRQRPGSASGVIFMTLEDEGAVANLVVWPNVFERFRPIVLGARLVAATGRVQNQDGVIHVVVETMEDLSPLLVELLSDTALPQALARADEIQHPVDDGPERRLKSGERRKIAALVREEPSLAADPTLAPPTGAPPEEDASENSPHRRRGGRPRAAHPPALDVATPPAEATRAMPKGRNFH